MAVHPAETHRQDGRHRPQHNRQQRQQLNQQQQLQKYQMIGQSVQVDRYIVR